MNATKARMLINILAVIALLVSIFIDSNSLSLMLALVCMVCALAVLYFKLPQLSNVSEDNPKLKTLRSVTIFNVIFIAALIIFALLLENELLKISARQGQFIMSGILSAIILGFGNIAPKIPFNRYTGLRLPWTVRDEETWILAHRVMGYISLPIGILSLIGATVKMPMDTWTKVWFMGPLLLWIGIPAVLSGIFFYKKWK